MELNILEKLYKELEIEYSKEQVKEDIMAEWLTMKIDKNGKAYWWYLDNAKNMAIEIDTGKIIEDANEIDNLFFKGVEICQGKK